MTAPRWTYSEANASHWKPVFDLFATGGQLEREIPLVGNARSLHSLKIRIGDALKWLADQFTRSGNAEFKPYADIKPKLRFGIGERGLVIKVRQNPTVVLPVGYKPLSLDADTLNRLTAMSQDPKYTPTERQMFADTVKTESKCRRDTNATI